MKKTFGVISMLLALALAHSGCRRTEPSVSKLNNAPPKILPANTAPPQPALPEAEAMPVTLPVLDALFAQESFAAEVQARLQLTGDELSQLKKVAHDEVVRLRATNAEQRGGSTAEARARAQEAIRAVIGEEKTRQLGALARERWTAGDETAEEAKPTPAEPKMSNVPNNVPADTRIVVNAPSFRMDVFENGALVKSYKIGIGYPEFPLPTGLRKAQMIIFNPPWTPPDSPWVPTMEDVTPGETVKAGSKLNPLGPIKIPIGMPSLVHGGKSPSKIGTFASHGCVGMTSAQVVDFAKVLAQVSGTELSDKTVASYLRNRTKTRFVKLNQPIPVELRYETIVIEDGKLHIYRDVYDHNTNTEKNLRAVLNANGVSFEDLLETERAELMSALDAMSRRPGKRRRIAPPPANVLPSPATGANSASVAPAGKKPVSRNQKEVVIEIGAMRGKGYPAPVNLETGSGKPKTAPASKPPEKPQTP